jgi:hypothetical protein
MLNGSENEDDIINLSPVHNETQELQCPKVFSEVAVKKQQHGGVRADPHAEH